MKSTALRLVASASSALFVSCFFSACIFTDGPVMGGFSTIAKDPLGALEEEPPDTPPNPHMDPVVERYGAFSIRWEEDLTKSSNNTEPDPDDLRNEN